MTNTSSIVRRAAQIAVILLGSGDHCLMLTLHRVLRNEELLRFPVLLLLQRTTNDLRSQSRLSVTLQLVTIDIPATEKANHQPPGSFGKTIEVGIRLGRQPHQNYKAEELVAHTNKDLEPFASARRKSELAYERRRRNWGCHQRKSCNARLKAAAVAERRKLEQSFDGPERS